MALAEVFESFVGPDAPLEFAAYDGSRAGAPGSPVKVTVRSPVAVAYLAQAAGCSSAWPGPTWLGTWTSKETCTRPWPG